MTIRLPQFNERIQSATLSAEESERLYWSQLKHDSHKWVEFYPNCFECEYCKAQFRKLPSPIAHSLCFENPNLFPKIKSVQDGK